MRIVRRWVLSLCHIAGVPTVARFRLARAIAPRTVCQHNNDPALGRTTDGQVDGIVARAQLAQRAVADWEEDRVDALLYELSEVVSGNAKPLAFAAVAETEMGNVADKIRKIEFAARSVCGSLVGRVGHGAIGTDGRGVTAVASPVGVVFALLPVTNPVATIIDEVLICLKGRNALVLSPHPRAQKVSEMTVMLLEPVFRAHGAPPAIVQIVPGPLSQRRTELFMAHQGIALVLVTGGVSIVKAAYRSGTPTIGVGPGNTPAYVAADADPAAAARAIVEGKAFDNGIICGSEQHIVADRSIAARLLEELRRAGAVTLDADESDRLLQTAFDPLTGGLKPEWSGRRATQIAAAAHINRRYPFRLLVFLSSVGNLPDGARRERLAPITAFYTVRDASDLLQ
jgi:acyl-CoA reductase-like NAD-dependent aldehyde dehydrogenase